jgi:hypothetical protein
MLTAVQLIKSSMQFIAFTSWAIPINLKVITASRYADVL